MMSSLVRPGDCFVDIGAHCGLYSRLASRRLGATGTVIAVEPNPVLHPYLQANLNVERLLTAQELTVGSVNIVGAAVAAENGEAVLHIGEAGGTAYLSLRPIASVQFTHTVPVATRRLESLVVTTTLGGQFIIKLATKGLEFDIVQQAVPFLKSRDDIHLMIEFDENNQKFSGHTTGDLRKLLGDTGFALAMFDPESGMLVEHYSETPLFKTNLVATKAIDLLNDRLRTIPEAVAQETNDFLQSGAVAEAIYRRSEQLDPVLRAIDSATGVMADIAASLEGRTTPKGSSENNDAIATAPSALVASMQDQLAQLEVSARLVAQQLDAYRQLQTETIKVEKALQTARLDLAALIAKATGLAVSERGSAGSASLKLEHSIKTALTTAASHLSYGLRSLSVVAPASMPVESGDLSSELNRLRTAHRDLLAEIHRLGLIANKARRSRWLKLGDRLGADATRQLNMIATLIADIEKRADLSDDQSKAQA